ncbi:substrate-binding domain-containing protein [Fundicoccus culcitae]|uniref:Substrate-binding domain-containing protein n=1 Tax=Fundicoccus culcitae TaxID=2969821 RepID=A0ABY5P3A3_9LACT|nr:substrate-binding domain-containing protein [Fundicoccus culcitae]UUX32928.1 substrate-binding domain-containing protein [Fundicoccus culcitae]
MKKSFKVLPMLAVAGLALSSVSVLAQEGPITVVSREDGSGTRGAFVEIVGVVDENDDDMTSVSAVIQNSTNGVMQTVAGDPAAIGYISLGSLDDSVKPLLVDGAEATPEAILAGEYPISRPFNVAWTEESFDEVTQDFLSFIHSAEGQAIVEGEGYIQVTPAGDAIDGEATEEEATEEEATEEEATEEAATELPSYEAAGLEGTIEVVGSTSVTPVMEVLAEEYQALNPNVTVNVTSNGSTAGMEAAMNGTANLGMASRELSDEEKEVLQFDAIALDGIAVIVHNDNPLEEISLDNVRAIFLGELTDWSELAQ